MPTFSSGGVDIHYQIAGEGYPMVLSHEFDLGLKVVLDDSFP